MFAALKFECCSLCYCVLTVVVCVVSIRLLAVTELILRCKTTKGIVEERVKHGAENVLVSRRFLHVAQLSHIVFSLMAWV
jgi:hypothetical protein